MSRKAVHPRDHPGQVNGSYVAIQRERGASESARAALPLRCRNGPKQIGSLRHAPAPSCQCRTHLSLGPHTSSRLYACNAAYKPALLAAQCSPHGSDALLSSADNSVNVRRRSGARALTRPSTCFTPRCSSIGRCSARESLASFTHLSSAVLSSFSFSCSLPGGFVPLPSLATAAAPDPSGACSGVAGGCGRGLPSGA